MGDKVRGYVLMGFVISVAGGGHKIGQTCFRPADILGKQTCVPTKDSGTGAANAQRALLRMWASVRGVCKMHVCLP